MTSVNINDVIEIIQTLWPIPSDFWTILTACSKKLVIHLGPQVLPILKTLKKLMSNASDNPDEVDSWTRYDNVISEDEYITISFPSETWHTVLNTLARYTVNDTTENCLTSTITPHENISNTSEYICSYTPDNVCTISSLASDGKFLVQMQLIPLLYIMDEDDKICAIRSDTLDSGTISAPSSSNSRREENNIQNHAQINRKRKSRKYSNFSKPTRYAPY